MSGETPRKIGRGYARNLDAGPFQPMIGSFDLHLRAEHKSSKTITIYTDAATWFASASLVPAGLTDWSQVTARHVQEWVSTLLAGYTGQGRRVVSALVSPAVSARLRADTREGETETIAGDNYSS